jgi:hypothetical protein
VKKFIVKMMEGHGMVCMAQKYHGDEEVDGLLCKISNASITYVDE